MRWINVLHILLINPEFPFKHEGSRRLADFEELDTIPNEPIYNPFN